jgi:hypothetical protein
MKDARTMALALLDERSPEATICPSEVARKMSDEAQGGGEKENWRAAMPAVHEAIDRLVAEGVVSLSWKGVALPQRDGPYRIRRVKR